MNLRSRRCGALAFSLIELMVTMVIAAVVIAGIYSFVSKTRKTSTIQRLRADTESLTQIAFFIIGRDIRRAGSNPKGALGYATGTDIPLAQASFDALEIRADLNGDGTITPNTDEDITYQYVDNPDAPDGIKDRIVRQSGNQLVIENVRAFDIDYQVASGGWYCKAGRCPAPYDVAPWTSPPPIPALIRVVRIHLIGGTGRLNPNTGIEDTKEIQMDFMLRNFR